MAYTPPKDKGSRPKPKPKPKRFLFAALILPFVFLSACSTDMLHVDAIKGPMLMVADRHDVYVYNDPALAEDDREIYLRTSELIRAVLEEASR